MEVFKDTITSGLKELGLTGYASRSFLSILENQPVSATSLCKLTGIPDSKIYYALKELEEKNLIMAQHGTPSLYRTQGVSQIASNLQSQLEEEYKGRSRKVKELAKLLEPLYSSRGDQDVELAYIVKGGRNIVEKMRETIGESKIEVLVMFSDAALLTGIADALKEARGRGLAIKLAVPKEMLESAARHHLMADKTLHCQCNVLIADSERLITISGDNAADLRAIVTQDESMILMSKKNYDNPSCCVRPRSSSAGRIEFLANPRSP